MNLRTLLFLLIIVFILFYLAILPYYYNKKPTVCISRFKCLNVEIADDEYNITRGLMYRDTLKKDTGMLFVFKEESIYNFWMKNMKFPIDIIWIDSNLTIAHIERNVPPCNADPCPKYAPKNKARYVLETSANFTSKNDVDIGTKVGFYNVD